MNIIDFLLIGIIALCVLNGSKQGLVRMVFSLGKGLMSLFLAYLLMPIIADILKTTPVYTIIYDLFYNAMGQQVNTMQADLLSSISLPTAQVGFLEQLIASGSQAVSVPLDTQISMVSLYLTDLAINCLALIIASVVLGIVIEIVGNALNIVAHIPGLNLLNRLGGMVIGFFAGVLIAFLVFNIGGVLLALNPSLSPIIHLLNNSAASGILGTTSLMKLVLPK